MMKPRVNSWKRLNESRAKLEDIIKKADRQGCSHSELVRLPGTKGLLEKATKKPKRKERNPGKLLTITGLLCTIIFFTSIHTHHGFTFWLDWMHEKKIEERPCTITMPDEVVKIFRPPVACSICLGVTSVEKVSNLFPEEFEQRYAYTGRPVVVTDAMTNWTAQHVFDFDFFKKIYTKRMDRWAAYNCQFFPYGTEFKHLSEVFNMSKNRALMAEGATPWYVGWSNCDEEINQILRRHYQRPYFLPVTAETKKLDWIFMGSTGFGAPMHVDNVEHPSWQAQLRGRKKWNLQPPPECFYVCQTIQIIVEPGEIIVLDTNQWYHSTMIVSKEMSITIGAEYD